jgi:DNA-binding MarR family transcriptional regulator
MTSLNNHSLFLLFLNRFCYEVGRLISRNYNLTVNERNTLIVLTNLKIDSVSELSRYLSISKTNTSKVLNALEKKDLIIRTLDKSDKRQNQLLLSEKGKATAELVIAEISNLFEKRISQFPDQLGERIKNLVNDYSEQKKLNSISTNKFNGVSYGK